MILGVRSIGGLHIDFVWSLVGHIFRLIWLVTCSQKVFSTLTWIVIQPCAI